MDKNVIKTISECLRKEDLSFGNKPIVIGGMAMQYYGVRKAGRDIDLVITNI